MSAQDSSKILHAIGTVKFERRTDGSFWVRHPIEGRAVFDPGEEKEEGKRECALCCYVSQSVHAAL